MRRTWVGLGLALASGAVLAAPFGLDHRIANHDAFITEVDGAGATYKAERVFPKLTFQEPVYLTHASDGSGRLYVVERRGVVWELDATKDPATETPARRKFLDISSRVQSQQGNELGLLSIAFQGEDVYAFYSTGSSFSATLGPNTVKNRVSRFKTKKEPLAKPVSVGIVNALHPHTSWFDHFVGGIWGGLRGFFGWIGHFFHHASAPSAPNTELVVDPSSEEVLLEIPKAYFNHNGGQLQFGPDHMLYVSVGDGGAAGDVERNGQNLRSLKAKILRIDPSAPSGALKYTVPADNPFVGNAKARGEVWAYGLRNPWRFSFDRSTGALWAGDVGQDEWEEVDVVTRGGNYGWSALEGTHPYNKGVPAPGAISPVVQYSHGTEGSCIIGGYVYRGPRLPGLQGAYVYGDYSSGSVWALRWDGTKVTEKTKLFTNGQLSLTSFGEDEAGEVYLCSLNGPIFRFVATGASTSHFPRRLSETHLFSDVASLTMRPELLPYDVIEPLWSDGAKKSRWMAIPHLDQVERTQSGGWRFPEGSVLVKHFFLGKRPVETRLMVRARGQWTGYSYEWNDQGTDGELLDSGKKKRVGSQEWTFPSRSECFRCHSAADGVLLGPQTPELNSELDYGVVRGRKANQLETLAHIGVFTKPLPPVATLPRLVNHDDASASLEARARSYLHVNCSICHRPGGGAAATLDLRFDTPLDRTGMLETPPQAGDLGVSGARLVKKGDPSRSVLYLRMSRRGQHQMPPLGSAVVDSDGSRVIAEWIRSLR